MRSFRNLAILALILTLGACSSDDNPLLTRTNIPITGGQEVPATNVTGNGNMTYTYNRDTKTLSYTVNWTGLSGSVTGMHIHGSAIKGFNAPIVQNFSGYKTTAAGTYTGTLFVDGAVIKEEDLLHGGYYVNIHTANNPGGEIRGQIIFE